MHPSIKAGDDLALEVYVSGQPFPLCSWLANGKEICNNSRYVNPYIMVISGLDLWYVDSATTRLIKVNERHIHIS